MTTTLLTLLTTTALVPPWSALRDRLPSAAAAEPLVRDAALDASEPSSAGVPILFRERNGWCPYSERVWLAVRRAPLRPAPRSPRGAPPPSSS